MTLNDIPESVDAWIRVIRRHVCCCDDLHSRDLPCAMCHDLNNLKSAIADALLVAHKERM